MYSCELNEACTAYLKPASLPTIFLSKTCPFMATILSLTPTSYGSMFNYQWYSLSLWMLRRQIQWNQTCSPIAVIKQYYDCTTDWDGTLYAGITLKLDYDKRTVDLSMPAYVQLISILSRLVSAQPKCMLDFFSLTTSRSDERLTYSRWKHLI